MLIIQQLYILVNTPGRNYNIIKPSKLLKQAPDPTNLESEGPCDYYISELFSNNVYGFALLVLELDLFPFKTFRFFFFPSFSIGFIRLGFYAVICASFLSLNMRTCSSICA